MNTHYKKIEIVEINVIFKNEQFFKQVTTTTFILYHSHEQKEPTWFNYITHTYL